MRGFTESLRQELDIENCGVSALCVHPGGIRTNIANDARLSDSMKKIGMNPEKSIKSFNKLMRKPAVEASQEILDAVLKNTVSYINKAASQGVVHKNNAARKVSRLSKKVHSFLHGKA